MNNAKVAIFGSSGMARSVVDIADTMGFAEIVFIDREDGVESITGISIVCEDKVMRLADEGFVFGMGIGSNAVRRKIAEKFSSIPFVNMVHGSANFGRGSRELLAKTRGNIIMAGAVLSGNITFGNFGLFNFNCIVGHDVHFGEYVHLGPGAFVAGNVNVGDNAYIWAGAMVRNGGGNDSRILIGENAVLGMGAAAISSVPDGTSVPPNRVYVSMKKS